MIQLLADNISKGLEVPARHLTQPAVSGIAAERYCNYRNYVVTYSNYLICKSVFPTPYPFRKAALLLPPCGAFFEFAERSGRFNIKILRQRPLWQRL
jgi:hypothetical protein